MKLGPIVLLLRNSSTRFGSNIAGAAELDVAFKNTLNGEMAFVIPLTEDAVINDTDSAINQSITERFGVVVALRTDINQTKKLGLGAYDQVHDIRNELFKPLVGLDLGYGGLVYYRGARLLDMHRGYMWYQFEFEFKSRASIDPELGIGVIETYDVGDRTQVSQLPDLDDISTQYILHPSFKWDTLKEDHPEGINLPIDSSIPDMDQLIDFTTNPDDGSYAFAFGTGFDVDNNK